MFSTFVDHCDVRLLEVGKFWPSQGFEFDIPVAYTDANITRRSNPAGIRTAFSHYRSLSKLLPTTLSFPAADKLHNHTRSLRVELQNHASKSP